MNAPMTLPAAAAIRANPDADRLDHKAANAVLLAAIVEIVQRRGRATSTNIRAELKKAGAVVHTSWCRSIAHRAVSKGLLACDAAPGLAQDPVFSPVR